MALAIAAFNGNCCWHYSNREMPRISRGKNGFSLMPSLRNGRNILLKNNRGIRVMSPETSSPSFKVDQFLDAWDDEYGGIIIDPNNLPSSVNAFASALRASLSNWKLKGKKGIWLKILLEQADFIPIAIQEGFNYHHAEPGYVMLTYWIPDEPCLLPSSPSHQIGVGGFVINDKRDVLVVKEKCPCSCSGVWKMPTGYINKFEDIFSGVIREVKEETGVDTIFLKLVAFRHAHRVAFDKSDILFVCVLKPLSYEITVDEKELQAAKWMALDEYMEQPFYEEDHMSRRVIDACIAAHDDHYNGFVAHQLTSKLDGKLSYLYYDSSSTF
ncbi:nudix hydrolase 8 isoform X1 [Jatropha curcas]|uniref:nudix hydrolase 8 isoform X1 n=1 Tax=Jatropha curcas TaxID=180498 RepID=UPI0005FB8BE0|nr:nudix hydrolase 8 isoform X1 [Jatropha curcas]